MSQALTLARPYARAAFALAREAGALPAWSQALNFAARVAAEPQVAALLGHPALRVEDAVELLAPEGADERVRRFLALLAENKRLALLPEIADLFEALRLEAERVVKARVTAAAPLGPAEIEKIKAALRRRFGREIEVETAQDPSLIGGAVIDAGDVVIDGSLRSKLERLQTVLAS